MEDLTASAGEELKMLPWLKKWQRAPPWKSRTRRTRIFSQLWILKEVRSHRWGALSTTDAEVVIDDSAGQHGGLFRDWEKCWAGVKRDYHRLVLLAFALLPKTSLAIWFWTFSCCGRGEILNRSLEKSFSQEFMWKASSMWGTSKACGKILVLRVKFGQNLF